MSQNLSELEKYLYTESQAPKKNFLKKHPVLVPIALFIILTLIISVFAKAGSKPAIGVLKIEGAIMQSEPFIKKLRHLERKEKVKGIILRINSPGGAIAPSQEVYREVLRIRKKKKVYVSFSSVAASGGYYIAVAGNKIFANPGSLTGSIGVIMQFFNIEELLGKIGLKPIVIKSGKNKDIGSMYRRLKPEERKLIQDLINDSNDQFITAVADNRPLTKKEVTKIADGRIFTGRKALKLKLVDELATFREVITKMAIDLKIKQDLEIYYVPDDKDNLINLLKAETGSWLTELLTSQTGIFSLMTLN